jgi:hypothetical protein
MTMKRVVLLNVLTVAPSFAAAIAHAQPAEPQAEQPVTIHSGYSPYELTSIREAQEKLGGSIDATPQGKTVEAIEILPLEVIEKRDPVPEWLNVFHTTTRPRILEREVLVRPGEKYNQALVDETARNLRTRQQLSLVLVVPFRGSRPDTVRLVVITKDVWSLRLNSDFSISPGGLSYLVLQPSETNLAGLHHTLSLRYEYLPLSQTFGLGYSVPRLDGRWLVLTMSANAIVNSRSGNVEGHYGAASIIRPLYSTLTQWGWATGVAWRDAIERRYIDAREAAFALAGPNGIVNTGVPYEYRARSITESAQVTRSFGWATKNDFTLGAEMNRRVYHTTADQAAFDPAYVAQFQTRVLPVSDTRVGPYAQWRGYTTNYLRVLDFEALGLQEDYRLGHDLWFRVYPVTTALGSSRTFVGTYAAAQYTVRLGDGLARASVESTVEAESDQLSDAAAGANLRIVTPRLGFGRFVADGAFLNRYRNYLNQLSYIGGDTRLRGYPTAFFAGKNVITGNIEFRSRPIEILASELGMAAFYDVGDAFPNVFESSFVAHQSAGVGLRLLLPQIDKVVLRGDFGFPIGPIPAGVSRFGFFFAFQQAFPMETVGGTSASGGTGTTAAGGALGQ